MSEKDQGNVVLFVLMDQCPKLKICHLKHYKIGSKFLLFYYFFFNFWHFLNYFLINGFPSILKICLFTFSLSDN